MLSMLIGAIGSLWVTPALIRSLGVAEFGVYVLVLTLASYAGFFDLGLTWAATRYFAEDLAAHRYQALASRFHTLVRFLWGVGAFSTLLVLTFGPWTMRAAGAASRSDLTLVLLLGVLSFGLSLQSSLVTSLLRAAQLFDEAGRVAVVGSLLLPLGVYASVRLGYGVSVLLAMNLAVNAVVVLLSLGFARSRIPLPQEAPRWRPAHLREMAAFGGWSCVSRGVMTVILQLDRLAVALLGSVVGLTYYSISANLASRINVLGGPMATLFFSRASFLAAGNRDEELAGQHAAATRVLICVALTAAIPLITLGPDFLRVWIGNEMARNGSQVLISLTVGYAIISVASLDAVTLEGRGRPDVTAKAMVAWSGVAIVGMLVLAPSLGWRAIAYAVAVWLAGVGVTNMIVARRLALPKCHRAAQRFPLFGILISLGVGIPLGMLLQPVIRGLPSAFMSLGLLAITLLIVGFRFILQEGERRQIIDTVYGLLTSRARTRVALARDEHEARP